MLQADVELATSQRRLLELERLYRVAIARINTLAAPQSRRFPAACSKATCRRRACPASGLLREIAVTQRPDLAAMPRECGPKKRRQPGQKQFYPDTEVYGRYDSFWQPAATQGDLRGQVGVNMNMPIYRGKLNAAVNEAQLQAQPAQAEYRQKLADVRFDVESAFAQVRESQQAIELYRTASCRSPSNPSRSLGRTTTSARRRF